MEVKGLICFVSAQKLAPSLAHGKTLGYVVSVNEQHSSQSFSTGAEELSHSLSFCDNCEVTVCARNSRGRSPPATVTVHSSRRRGGSTGESGEREGRRERERDKERGREGRRERETGRGREGEDKREEREKES